MLILGGAVFDPITRRANAGSGRVGGDIQDQGQIGQQSPGRHLTDSPEILDRKAAGHALIDDVREQETIRDHHAAGREGMADHLVDELCPAGHVDQHFRPDREVDGLAIQDDLAEPVANLRAAWVAARDHVESVPAQPARQPGGLSGLAAPVRPLQGKEKPGMRMRARRIGKAFLGHRCDSP